VQQLLLISQSATDEKKILSIRKTVKQVTISYDLNMVTTEIHCLPGKLLLCFTAVITIYDYSKQQYETQINNRRSHLLHQSQEIHPSSVC